MTTHNINITLICKDGETKKMKSYIFHQINPELSDNKINEVAGALSTLIDGRVLEFRVTKDFVGDDRLTVPEGINTLNLAQ